LAALGGHRSASQGHRQRLFELTQLLKAALKVRGKGGGRGGDGAGGVGVSGEEAPSIARLVEMGLERADIDKALETSSNSAERAAEFLVNLSPDLSEILDTDDEAAAAGAGERAASGAGVRVVSGAGERAAAGAGERAAAGAAKVERPRAVAAAEGIAAVSEKAAAAAAPADGGQGMFWCSVCNITFKTPQGSFLFIDSRRLRLLSLTADGASWVTPQYPSLLLFSPPVPLCSSRSLLATGSISISCSSLVSPQSTPLFPSYPPTLYLSLPLVSLPAPPPSSALVVLAPAYLSAHDEPA